MGCGSTAKPAELIFLEDRVARPAESAEEAKAGKELVRVYDEYSDFVYASLQRLGVPSADLEDLFQEVFVVLHRKLQGFEGRSTLRTWIFGVCVGLVRNDRRLAHRRHVDRRATLPESSASTNPSARLDAERVLAAIDPEKRAVFVMYEAEQLSCVEIAETLGVPVGTIYSRLHAARKEIEAVVARERR